jgi:hypothetical protein
MIDVSMHYGKKVLSSLQKKNNTVNRCEHYFFIDNNDMTNEQHSLSVRKSCLNGFLCFFRFLYHIVALMGGAMSLDFLI